VITGVPSLAGKTVIGLAAGAGHSLALCSDGGIAAWGENTNGQLGQGYSGASPSPVPVAVSVQAGISALYGKTVMRIAAGAVHSLAVCTDGTLAAWGNNSSGQLGDNSNSPRSLPVVVNSSALVAGEKFIQVANGCYADHTIALAASPPLPEITVFNGTSTATLDARQSNSGSIDFAAIPMGTSSSSQTFTIKNSGTANLTGLVVTKTGTSPSDFTLGSLGMSTLAPNATTTFTVIFSPSAAGARSAKVQIASNDPDENPFEISVSGTGIESLAANYKTAADVPLTAGSYDATGKVVLFSLNFTPTTGAQLTVVKNTGLGFITGAFNNLTQGQLVTLSHGGSDYQFVANYFGGTGNDLVLVWAAKQPFAWGKNNNGQLGDNSTTPRASPVTVSAAGVLAGKTIFAMASGDMHSLALCSDGTLAAWGDNSAGQLGDGTTTQRLIPGAIPVLGTPLAGKTIVAIAASGRQNLALCSDGTLTAWGDNTYGQLGDDSTTQSSMPVSVNTAGVLSGKTIVSVAAGKQHCLALCSDGTLVSWGDNGSGQLGDGTTTQRNAPVLVATAGTTLEGRTVAAIAAGAHHNLVQCTDGGLAAWGWNYYGNLGDGSYTQRNAPVTVITGGTPLSGKTVVSIAAGYLHNLALCSDGTLAIWGNNANAQLGNGSTSGSATVPTAITTAGTALAGKTVTAVTAGGFYSLALCSDGTMAGWGRNNSGQIGNNTFLSPQTAPVIVYGAQFTGGKRLISAVSGAYADHTLAIVALPPAPEICVFDGSGTGGAERQSNTGTLAFEDTSIGAQSNSQTFTIQNKGTATLSGLTLAKTGDNPGDFILGSLGATTLAPNATTTFTVTFAPTAARARAAVVQIASNDADENPFLINVTGNWLTAVVNLGSLNQVYDGTAKSATATTIPSGLTVDFTYNGSATAPTNSGSYTVIGTVNDATYAGSGSATGTMIISKAAATVTLGGLNQAYDGTAKSATATTAPSGLTVNLTYDDLVTAPTLAGSYAVVGTISDANYAGNGTGTLTITAPALPAGAWTTVAPMSTPRWGSAAGAINGVLYVAGGYNGSHVTTVNAYNPSSNTWSPKTSLPGIHTSSAFGVINGLLYLAGGTNNSTYISTVRVFDPVANSWTAKASTLSLRSQAAAGVLNGLLYVAGGSNSSGYVSTLEAYNPAGNSWSAKAAMPTPRSNLGVSAANGILYAIGGIGTANLPLGTVEAYDPVANSWTTKAPMPTARFGVAVVNLNDTLYAIGGSNGNGTTIYSTVEAYDPEHDTWTTLTPLNVAASTVNAVILNNLIYVSGGNVGAAGAVSTTEYFTLPVSTGVASAVTASTASLNGSVNPAGNTVPMHFEYGLTSAYGTSTTPQNATGSSGTPVTVAISGLAPGTTYHYRLVGSFGGAWIRGQDQTFSTPSVVSYNTWAQGKFTADELQNHPELSGPNAVYSQDGMTNLLKYALGLEPKTNTTTGLPALNTTATDWSYTYTRPDSTTGVTYTVEVSTNLTVWTTAGVTHEFVSSSGGIQTWHALYPKNSATKTFFHLKVTDQ